MPDPTKQTVSASQIPAILNCSPYATRWLMHQHFANGMPLEVVEDERMTMGRELESTILRVTAQRLRVDILGHPQADYLRHPSAPIGCTPDGHCFDAQRGFGIIEAKNVDWIRHRDTWTDDTAPAHIEAQVQTQLAIPHPEHGPAKWACIAVLVGGNELMLYERQPLPDVHARIVTEAAAFLADVKAGREPEVTGRAIELEGLTWAYPTVDLANVLTDADFPDPVMRLEVARLIEGYHDVKARKSVAEALEKEFKAKLQALAGDAAEITVHRRFLKIQKSAIEARTQSVKAHTRVLLTPKILDYAQPIAEIAEALEPEFPKDILV